jgi:hypothetical protein
MNFSVTGIFWTRKTLTRFSRRSWNPASATPPAILLLSATPYRLLATRWDEARGALAQEELLKLIDFLAGPKVQERARTLFADFGDKLRGIAAHADASSPELKGEVAEAARFRDALRTFLTPVMSRTERDSVASADPLAGTKFLHADPSPEDFQVYRHLADSFAERMRYEALPWRWQSMEWQSMEVAMSESHSNEDQGGPHGPKSFEIKIDRTMYKVDEPVLTGAQLRALPNPPIGPDRDLFEVVPGGSDLKIENDTAVEMRNGLRFFTAPAQINPGRS